MANEIKLEGGITEQEFEEMEESLKDKMTFRCLCSIFSELKDIKMIVNDYQKTNKWVAAIKNLIIAGLGGLAGSLLTQFGTIITKFFER